MMTNADITPKLESDSLALVSLGPNLDGDHRKKPWCDHYKKPWHTRETCWQIHGKLAHMKKSPDGKARKPWLKILKITKSIKVLINSPRSS